MKTAVIFHGFPDALKVKSPLYSFLKTRKYQVIMPGLLVEQFPFRIDEIIKYVTTILGNTYPDVIIGISLGGMIAPFLAPLYPKSKLILIGTGPYFKTKIWIYNFLVNLEARDKYLYLIRLLKFTPKPLFRFVYKVFNKSKTLKNTDYRKRADENYTSTFIIPNKKIKEILKFVTTTNNSKLLKSLTNKTLIYAGKSDFMMPLSLSNELNFFIKDSRLVVSDRLHYDVFSKTDEITLDKFLSRYEQKNAIRDQKLLPVSIYKN